MKILFFLLLFVPFISFGQSGTCKVPKVKVKVIQANNVTQNGEAIKKGDEIIIDQKIPDGNKDKFTKRFFECNGLSFQVNGELVFRYSGSLVNKKINYFDYNLTSGKAIAQSSNLSTRGDSEGGSCSKELSDSQLFMLSLLEEEKTINGKECLEYYFNEDYWLADKDILNLNPAFFETLIITYEKEDFRFPVENGKAVVNSKELPESGLVNVYTESGGKKTLISKNLYLINLKKLTQNLKEEGFSDEDIKNYITQNLDFFDDGSLSEKEISQIESRFEKLLN